MSPRTVRVHRVAQGAQMAKENELDEDEARDCSSGVPDPFIQRDSAPVGTQLYRSTQIRGPSLARPTVCLATLNAPPTARIKPDKLPSHRRRRGRSSDKEIREADGDDDDVASDPPGEQTGNPAPRVHLSPVDG